MRKRDRFPSKVDNMALNQKAFERKLQNMNSTQESVQTVSLWIIHHKKQAEEIVLVWLDQLKKVPKPDRRLTLFYLANDVLQNSRKKTKDFITAFSKVLREAMPLLSEKSIEASVQRVIKIWEERKVFERDFLQGLRSKLGSDSHKEKKKELKPKAEESKPQKAKHLPPTDFKPSKLIDSIKSMGDFEAELTLKESQLNSLRIDASDAEIIGHLKDRAGSTKFWQEYEEASHKLEEFCQTLVKEQEQRNDMVTMLQDGEAFFDVAFGEVKVIVNAYKTFGNRLNSLKKKLDTKINKLAVKEAERAKTGVVSAPTGSFLSTGLPQMMSDSAASSPAQTPPRKDDVEVKLKDTTIDNIEVSDMDIEDDSDSEAEKPDSSDTPATQSSEDNTPSQASSNSDVKAVDATPSTLPSVTNSGTVSTVGAEPAVGTTQAFGLTPSAASVPNLDKTTAAEGAQAAVTPSMLPTQAALLAAQAGLVPPPMPPSFMGIGMPVQFPSVGLGVPQMIGVRARLQNGPGPLLIAGSGIPTIAYQQQIGAVSVTGGLPNNAQGVLQSSLSGGPAPFVSRQNQITLTGSLATGTPATSSTAQAEEEENLYSPSQCQSSPQSDDSAPSPEGSPELNLDDVTSSSLLSKAPNLNGFQTNKSFLSNVPSSGVDKSSEKRVHEAPSTSAQKPESASSTPGRDSETSVNSTPAQAQQDGKSVSAVDILAKLLSRGRQLKELSDTQTPPRTDTPPSDTPPHVQPVEPVDTQPPSSNPQKPLLSLIDSLFPKLSDSLKTLKQKEQKVQNEEQVAERPRALGKGVPSREEQALSSQTPPGNCHSNPPSFQTTVPDGAPKFPPKSILRRSHSGEQMPQSTPQLEGQNQPSHHPDSSEGSNDKGSEAHSVSVTEKEQRERSHFGRPGPPSKIDMDRLQARRPSQESAAVALRKPDHQRSPGSFPPDRLPFGRHSPRSSYPEGPPGRPSREEVPKAHNEMSQKPFPESHGESSGEKHSPRGSFPDRPPQMPPVKPQVDKLPEEEQSKAPLRGGTHGKQEAEERKGPPITNAPLVGQSGTFGYTKQDPTIASDFGIEPHSPEPVQVTFPIRPPMHVGPRGPGADFMGLRGPPPRPGPWSGPPREVPPQGAFVQPRMQQDAPFPVIMREREMIHPEFDRRHEFRGDEQLPREFPPHPEHFQQQRPGPFPRVPPEEGRIHPGPFPRAPEEGRPRSGPFPRVPEEDHTRPGPFPRISEEGHSRVPEGHHPPGATLRRGPEEHRLQPVPFPRSPDDRCPPLPHFVRGPGDHPPSGHFSQGHEPRPPPTHVMRGPEVHRPNEPRSSESFQRSPERRVSNPMDFMNDDPSTWTSFEGGRRTPPHIIDQEQRRGNMFPERPINSRMPHEGQRHPFQNFGDNNELAQRDFMMKRPGPPIRFPGPPPQKRPFPF